MRVRDANVDADGVDAPPGTVYAPRRRARTAETSKSTRMEILKDFKASTLTRRLRVVEGDGADDARAWDDKSSYFSSARERGKENDRAARGGVDVAKVVGTVDAPATAPPRTTRRMKSSARLALVAIEQWRWVVRHGKGARSVRARERREVRLMKTAFAAMRARRREGSHRALRAKIYWRLGATQRAFAGWRGEVERARDNATQACVRRCVRKWRETTEARAEAREARARMSEQIAWYHDCVTSMRRALGTWRRACEPEARGARARMEFYDRYARKTLLKRAIDGWRDAARRQMDERTNALIATSFDEVKTLSRAMRAWKIAHRDSSKSDADDDKVETFRAFQAVNALSSVFSAWVDQARETSKRARASEATPAKTRAGRTKHALYAWLFDRSKANDYEEEVLDFLETREAAAAMEQDRLDEVEDFEQAVDEYEELREEAKRLIAEAKTLKNASSKKAIARRRVLKATAAYLSQRREELLPVIRRAAGAENWRSRSVGTSSLGFSILDDDDDADDDADDDTDDAFLRRKY